MTPSRVSFPQVCIAVVLVLSAPRAAQSQIVELKGSADHPTISRYAGSTIIGHDVRKFDEFVLPLSPVKGRYAAKALPADKEQRLEGRVTRILYVAPPERSSLEVLRNYEQELKKSGFGVMFSCAGAACDGDGYSLGNGYLYTTDRALRQGGNNAYYALGSPKDQRYLAARRSSPKGDVYASVYVATNTSIAVAALTGRTIILLDIVETTPMETAMVTVDASAMAKDIAASGRVALYGIYFDTNRSEIKSESTPTLQEIAKLLKGNPELKLYIVGHTDNVGGFESNLALSERRAAAVLSELTTKYGIQAGRLRHAGAGLMAPVALNSTEQGRAKNRRVELVMQ